MKYPQEEKVVAAIRQALAEWSLKGSDDELIAAFQRGVSQYGDMACRVILQTMASVDLPPGTAQKCWQEILTHRGRMSESLGRQVRLLTAICDYLNSCADEAHDLKLVDMQSYEKVVNDTIHDGLTGIYNRNYFSEALEQQVSLARRYDTEFSILFMDVDDFKDVNDTFGHQAGDQALLAITRVISQEKRESDVVARFGGEEFVLLMPHTGNINAFILGERIRGKISKLKITHNGMSFSITISGGIASFPVNGQDPRELLQSADSALYQAKGAGKDTIAQYKMDKRRYLRVKFCQQIKVKELGFNASEQFSGMSKDICSGGILFENKNPFPVGLRIQVSIPVQNVEPLLLIGTVVRVEAFSEDCYDIGMSISFKEMEKIAKHEISGYLKSERNPG